MDNVKLYIAASGSGLVQADLQGGDLITLQKRIGFVETGQTAFRQGEYSETFLLPDTPTNVAIFKTYFKAHGNNTPYRYPAYIYVNSYLIAKGVIEPDSVVFGVNGKALLKVNFLGEEVDFFLSLDEPLRTLDFSELDDFVTGSLTNINTLTVSQSAYYNPTASLSLGNSVKFGFVDYHNTPYYTNTAGTSYLDLGPLDQYVGLGSLNGGQHFYWSGSYNYLPGTGSSAPNSLQLSNNIQNVKTYTLGAPNSQSVDTLYGKGGFYLGHNYNAYFSNGYLVQKIVEQSQNNYVWEGAGIFPSDHSLLNSQLIYKDFSKPGTNQYWYKEVNDAQMSLNSLPYNYVGFGQLQTTASPPTATATLKLVDEQGATVASTNVSWTHTVTGNTSGINYYLYVTSSATGLWRVGMDAFDPGYYNIQLEYAFTTYITGSGH